MGGGISLAMGFAVWAGGLVAVWLAFRLLDMLVDRDPGRNRRGDR